MDWWPKSPEPYLTGRSTLFFFKKRKLACRENVGRRKFAYQPYESFKPRESPIIPSSQNAKSNAEPNIIHASSSGDREARPAILLRRRSRDREGWVVVIWFVSSRLKIGRTWYLTWWLKNGLFPLLCGLLLHYFWNKSYSISFVSSTKVDFYLFPIFYQFFYGQIWFSLFPISKIRFKLSAYVVGYGYLTLGGE